MHLYLLFLPCIFIDLSFWDLLFDFLCFVDTHTVLYTNCKFAVTHTCFQPEGDKCENQEFIFW